MSVILYKDGVSELFPPEYLEQNLAVGWSLTNDQTPDPDPEGEEQEEPVPKDEDGPSSPTNEEIRLLAQQAGIENWQTAQIKTLRSSLGLAQ